MSTFSTGKAAAYLGVGVKTLQRWDREGRLKPERTSTGSVVVANRFYPSTQICSSCGCLTGPKGREELHIERWV